MKQIPIGYKIMNNRKDRDTRKDDQLPPKIFKKGFQPKPIARDEDGNPLPVKPPPKKP